MNQKYAEDIYTIIRSEQLLKKETMLSDAEIDALPRPEVLMLYCRYFSEIPMAYLEGDIRHILGI